MIYFVKIIAKNGLELVSKTFSSQIFQAEEEGEFLATFLTALKSVSKSVWREELKQINFLNKQLFLRDFNEFIVVIGSRLGIEGSNMSSILEQIGVMFQEESGGRDDFVFVESYPRVEALIDELVKDHFPVTRVETHEISEAQTDKSFYKNIVLAGLGNAGKTSIYKKFFEQWDSHRLNNIAPTLGLATGFRVIDYLREQIQVIDLGGQAEFRRQHLHNNMLWTACDGLLYIIDIQDQEGFGESIDYLDKILERLKERHLTPPLFIFLHKYDRELREKGALQQNLIELLPRLYKSMQNKTFALHFSSIFDESLIQAMVRTLFFVLPNTIITRSLNTNAYNVVMDSILPPLKSKIKGLPLDEEDRELVRYEGISFGLALGDQLQEEWFNTLVNPEKDESGNLLFSAPQSSVFEMCSEGGMELLIKVTNATNEDDELYFVLMEGFLNGLTKTLNLQKFVSLEDRSDNKNKVYLISP